MTRSIRLLIAFLILTSPQAYSTSTDSVVSTSFGPLTPTAKIKEIQIDYNSANWQYVSMSAGGCPPPSGNTRYIQIGVTTMPNANYTTSSVSGEFDYNFKQDETSCVTWTYKYSYYSDGSWIWWVNGFSTPQIVCAPVTVIWS